MLAYTVMPWDLAFTGVVGGLVVALVAMGIVLVYRSSRIINFAVGSMGVPATALFAIMAAKHHVPYGIAMIGALVIGTLTGTVVELGIIRRLFRAPRVIVLVATIGVAQLMQAITLSLPDYKTGSLQTAFPLPFQGDWEPGWGVQVGANELLIVLVVPVITFALYWTLNHTAFGDAVRASSTNPDLARLTGISPKLISSAVWSIAGFLSVSAMILTATNSGSARLVEIGPETLLRGMTAALIGGMVSFPRATLGAIFIGLMDRWFAFHYGNEAGLAQFVLFLLVLVLVARVSRRDAEATDTSFQFAPRVAAIPERLRRIWWVPRMPYAVALVALAVAVVLPLLSDSSFRHQTWLRILGFAICAVSIIVLTGWAGQLSLGQMAFAGFGALTAASLTQGMSVDIGYQDIRILKGTLPELSFFWALAIGGAAATLVALAVGIGALRVRGLLLAISTLAFAVACEQYIFHRDFFTHGRSTVQIPRADIGAWELTHKNRAYYYFALLVLTVVLVVVGHLRRTGVGRMIIAVRENENAARQ